MNWLEIVLTGVALSMDACAIAVAGGAVARRFHVRNALRYGVWFGGAQAVMPLLGWLCGNYLKDHIATIDHWVAFVILAFIGGKMVWESFRIEGIEEARSETAVPARTLFVLAVATSLDAFSVGIIFSIQHVEIVNAVLIIGAVTFAISFAGVWIGSLGRHLLEKKMEFAGGVVLIAVGVKILLDHLLV